MPDESVHRLHAVAVAVPFSLGKLEQIPRRAWTADVVLGACLSANVLLFEEEVNSI